MSQVSQITIDNVAFGTFRSNLNDTLSALNTTQSGTSRPSSAVAGTIWLDTTTAASPTLKYYDGADDISLATLDHSANTVNWLDSAVSVAGLTTTATGTVLTLQDTNIEVSGGSTQGGEIRFKEDSDTGSNYTALKAGNPASNVTFTLPTADGTSGQTITTDGSGNLSFADTVGSDFGTSYFAANRTTDFTVTDQTFVKAQINNEIVDVGNNYDTSNYRYTAPATGKYFFYVRGYIDADVDGQLNAVEFYLKKNNSSYVAETIIDFQNTLGRKGGTTLTTILDLSASDYIEWWIYAKDNAGNPILKSNASSVAGGGNQFGGWRVA